MNIIRALVDEPGVFSCPSKRVRRSGRQVHDLVPVVLSTLFLRINSTTAGNVHGYLQSHHPSSRSVLTTLTDAHLADDRLKFMRIFVHPIRGDAELGMRALGNGTGTFLYFPASVWVARVNTPSRQLSYRCPVVQNSRVLPLRSYGSTRFIYATCLFGARSRLRPL